MTIAYRKAVDSHRVRRNGAKPVASLPERAAPDDHAVDHELWGAVRSLPPMQRAAVTYRFVNDLAYKDIASVLSCSEDSARQNVRVGLRRLREVLSE
jgi:DNA-directed RNA polymerase specialized sigma24 family protein